MHYLTPQVDFTAVNTVVDEAVWYLVFMYVLLGLGSALLLGAAVWCMAKGHGWFTGGWRIKNWGVSLEISCSR